MLAHSIIERRITLRMLSYWEKLRRGRPMPTEQDVDPDDIPDLWDSCFLIHIKDLDKPDYNYTYLGQKIVDAYEHGLSESEASQLLSPNAARLKANYTRVMQTFKPLVEEGEFKNMRDETVKYRQCLLPLGENGQVEAILGGMHYKIFA